MGSGALDALLHPRTFRVFASSKSVARRYPVTHSQGCRPAGRGAVDLGFVAAGKADQLPALLKRATATSRTVVLLGPKEARPTGALSRHVLGPCGGLWTPRVAAGIAPPARRPGPGRPACLALTQGTAVGERLLAAASQRRLPLLGVISAGGRAPALLLQLALEAAALRPQPMLLLALHRPLHLRIVDQIARAFERAAIMLTSSAGPTLPRPSSSPLPYPEARSICRALGLPAVRTPDELVALARLVVTHGVVREAGTALTVAASEEEAALMADALLAGGLEVARQGQPHDCVLFGPRAQRSSTGAKTPRPRFCLGDAGDEARRLDLSATSALAALLDWRGSSEPEADRARPRGLKADMAQHLLDGWPAAIHELQVKRVLECYGVAAPPEALAGSASRAGEISREIGLPVAVKAVGPNLCGRTEKRAIRLEVSSVSACRQAFRDVLQACHDTRPTPYLDGVLVSAMVPLPSILACTMLWPSESPEGPPPLLTLGVRPGRSDELPLLLPVPLSRSLAHKTAEALVDLGLGRGRRGLTIVQVRRLADFLRRISWLGPDLRGRLRWLTLDTVSPPAGNKPPLVIDARAEQTENLRAPDYR
jgi:ATP-grasp domain